MASNLFSWVFRPNRASPTMAEPSQRRLWCAFSENIDNMFPIDCNLNVDSIADVKKKIWSNSQSKIGHIDYYDLDLYSPSSRVTDVLTKENLVHLHPRKRILSDFPRSNDPDIDIIVIRPEEQQHFTATRALGSPEIDDHQRAKICTRDETVSKLAEALDSQKIIHVRGTPASGKSTLSLLLRDHYRRNGRTVFWLGIWEQKLRDFGDEEPWVNLARCIRCNYPMLDKKQNIFADDNVIILDEAQTSYGDTALWNQIIKDIRGEIRYKIKLCLFCSYGSPSEGLPYSDNRTPVGFGHAQRISLTPSGEPGAPPIGLFYNRDEFEIVVTKLCSSGPVEKYSIDSDARDYIFNFTNGHPGAVSSIVYYLFQVYRSQVKYKVISTITQDHVTQALADDNKVFYSLDGSIVFRSFPFPGKLTLEARGTLVTILEDGYILFDESSDGIRCCYENGWIHRAIQGDSSLQQISVGVLASRLHEKYVEYLIGKTQSRFPEEVFPTIQSLCMEVLKRFSVKKLRHSVEGKLSTASKLRLLEAQYQDEFYRAFNSVAGRGVPISSEWSRNSNGRVDFWIPQKRWGIELLREHNNVDEHCNRFKKGGRYYPWIEAGMLKDWIVIDCATSSPSSEHSEPKLWRAVFDNDYSQLMLLDHRNNCLMGPTVLVN